MSHDNEEWYKFEEELTCRFKIDMRNVTNYDQGTRMTKKFALWSLINLILLTKLYNVWVKKVQRSCLSLHWRVMQNLKKNWFVVSKMTGIWWNLTQALKNLKNFHFDWFLFCKVYNVWPKTVQMSYVQRKTDLWFGKWHEQFGKFLPEHLKFSRLRLLWNPLSKAKNKWT